MKSNIIILISLCVATKVVGCAYPYDVTLETIESFPLLGYVSVNDERVSYRLHLRNTGNLLGLSTVYLKILDTNETELFAGSLSIFEDTERNVRTVSFNISKEKIQKASLRIIAYETKRGHTCVFSYSLPLELVHESFLKNEFNPLITSRFDDTSALDNFIKMKFKTDRGK